MDQLFSHLLSHTLFLLKSSKLHIHPHLCIHSLVHSSHPLTYTSSLVHSLTCSFSHPLNHTPSLVHSLTCSLNHPLSHPSLLVHSLTHSLNHPLTHLSSLMHSLTCLFSHPLTHTSSLVHCRLAPPLAIDGTTYRIRQIG